ncbi:MAG: acyl carrier protein [Oscillospiraceae bacterium]|nr:acyl carrier protein [Oscillospiraceae bacterium]
MNRNEVFQYIQKTIQDCMPDLDASVLTEDTILAETAIDSMAFMLIVCRVEGTLGVHIPESEWPRMQTISDVVDAVYSRLPECV